MRSNYKRLGEFIREIDERNTLASEENLLGVSVEKKFIPSKSNTIGTDFTNYKIVKRNQFVYVPDTGRRGEKIGLALLDFQDLAMVSQVYTVFEIMDVNKLMPEYLMMWFRRPEFNRYARFHSNGSVREIFEWESMCDMQLPVPSIDKQRGIVKEYDVIQDRIKLNEELIRKLEETAQAIYRQWFVDDVDKENFPEGWRVGKLKDISNQIMGFAFKGDLYNGEIGISVLRGENVSERFLRWDTHKKWNEEIIPRMEKCYLNENDIVIGMDGSKVGKNWALVSKYDLPLLLAQRVACLRGKKHKYQFFIFYSMCVLNFESHVSQVQTGTSIPHISGEQIFDFPVIIPTETAIERFDKIVSKMVLHNFNLIQENQKLAELKDLLLSKLATVEG